MPEKGYIKILYNNRLLIVFFQLIFHLTVSLSFNSRLYAQDIKFKLAGVYDSGEAPGSLAIGDLDNDEKNDFVVTNLGSNDITVHFGLGNCKFENAIYYNTDGGPCGIEIEDMNNDGYMDIVATICSEEEYLLIYKNNGDGAFLHSYTYEAGTKPVDLTINDFNNDQQMDIAVANYLAYTGVTILINKGNMQFETLPFVDVGNCPDGIDSADLDGDGNIDLAVSQCGSDISILYGKGDGYYSEPVFYGFNHAVGILGVNDINNDEYPDLAVPLCEGGAVKILLNKGNGTFERSESYISLYSPIQITLKDYNCDNNLDYAVINVSNSISVRSGNGDGTFNQAVYYSTEALPQDIEGGDFNNDGYPDMAVANYSSDTISIYKNITAGDDDDDNDNDDNNDNNNNDDNNNDSDDDNDLDDDTDAEQSPTPEPSGNSEAGNDEDDSGKCCG